VTAVAARVLHLVVPTIGRPTVVDVIRRALADEPLLARLTVVSQACPAVVDESLSGMGAAVGAVVEECRLDSRVGAARARLVGAGVGGDEDFVGFVDDDIVLDDGTFSQLVALCQDRDLGGAGGVVVDAPENTRAYRVLKRVLFRSIFRDPRMGPPAARGVVETPVLSGGVSVFRRSVFDACSGAMNDFPADYSWGEDFELSYRASLVSRLAIDRGVRVRNLHLGMSRAEVDRDDVARRRIERYRGFADRHAHRPGEWAAYLGVVAALAGMSVRHGCGRDVRRLLVGEAGHAVRGVLGAIRSPGDRGAPRNAVGGRATVAAVIVYFRSGRAVVGAVESLVGQGVAPVSVTVVANSPVPADIAGELADLGAVVVPVGDNVGFAAACNLGATDSVADYLWFVNPDVTCAKDCLETLLRPHAGPERAVSPALRHPDGSVERSAKSRSYLRPAVLLSRELGVGRALRLGSPAPPRRPRVVTAVSGACLLVPRAAFDRVGGFAEEFFLYGEDIDLCLRLRRVGCTVAVIPDARAVHVSGTGSGDPADPTVAQIKGREARRAHLLLLRRHRSDQAAARYLAGLVWVLRARRLVRPGSVGDRAASKWVADERRRGRAT
jgi:GT2 family glycosyltransferase